MPLPYWGLYRPALGNGLTPCCRRLHPSGQAGVAGVGLVFGLALLCVAVLTLSYVAKAKPFSPTLIRGFAGNSGRLVGLVAQPEGVSRLAGLRLELTAGDEGQQKSGGRNRERQPYQPPIGRRALAIVVLGGLWAGCYDRGCNAYLRGDTRSGDWWHGIGYVPLALGLFLCCTISVSATWGWWL